MGQSDDPQSDDNMWVVRLYVDGEEILVEITENIVSFKMKKIMKDDKAYYDPKCIENYHKVCNQDGCKTTVVMDHSKVRCPDCDSKLKYGTRYAALWPLLIEKAFKESYGVTGAKENKDG